MKAENGQLLKRKSEEQEKKKEIVHAHIRVLWMTSS